MPPPRTTTPNAKQAKARTATVAGRVIGRQLPGGCGWGSAAARRRRSSGCLPLPRDRPVLGLGGASNPARWGSLWGTLATGQADRRRSVVASAARNASKWHAREDLNLQPPDP